MLRGLRLLYTVVISGNFEVAVSARTISCCIDLFRFSEKVPRVFNIELSSCQHADGRKNELLTNRASS